MARPTRIHAPGTLFHVISRGNAGQTTFLDDSDYDFFLRSVLKVRALTRFRLLAYCLMRNHFHLLIEVADVPLWTIMQRILTRYSRRFNDRHERHGHVFQGRYKAFLCARDAYLLRIIRYIHLNPVRAECVADPGLYQWSSHTAYANEDAGFLDRALPFSLLDSDPTRARAAYLAFVAAEFDERHDKPAETKREGLVTRAWLGRTISQRQPEVDLASIANEVEQRTGVPVAQLRGNSRQRDVAARRKEFVANALKAGFRQTDIASYLGRTPSMIWWILK